MRIKMMGLLFIAALITMSGVNRPASAQEVISGNLLTNPGFEEGFYYQDGIPQIAAPNGWRYVWLDNTPYEGTNGQDAYRPETVVWYIEDAPPHERPLFFRDGSYTVKVFRNWAPILAALTQDVSGLEVGRKYRISAPIYIDMVEDYDDGGKVAPEELWTAFVRLGAGPTGATWLDNSQINYSPGWSAENVSPFFFSMPTFTWDFVATQPNMTIYIEVGVKQPLINGGFFIDGVGLYALSQTSSPPPASNPPPAGSGNSGSGSAGTAAQATAAATPTSSVTPREDGSIVHVVVANDTFWSIAIQYAPVLGIPAEQALTQIRELNGNPQFVVMGQELLIREAGNFVQGGTSGAEAQPTTEATLESTDEGGGETIVVEGAPLEETGTPEATAVVESQRTAICASAFDDIDGNGEFEANVDKLKADVAITLFKDGQTVSTYITDGFTEEHCFEDLTAGAYQVQLFPPANFVATTADSWAVNLSEGMLQPVQFGVQYREPEAVVAEVDSAANDTAVTEAPAPTLAPATTETTASDSSIFSNVGMFVIIAAVVLLLLAGAGIVMLRRG